MTDKAEVGQGCGGHKEKNCDNYNRIIVRKLSQEFKKKEKIKDLGCLNKWDLQKTIKHSKHVQHPWLLRKHKLKP